MASASVPYLRARCTPSTRRDGLGRRATRELQKPPVLEDEAAFLQSSVAAHERGAVDVERDVVPVVGRHVVGLDELERL